MDLQRITDPADPRVADYLDLRGGRPNGVGPVIVEGLLAVAELTTSPFPFRSVLVTPQKLARLPPLPEVTPVYVADLDVQRATVGFDLHRGVVASAERIAPSAAADVVRGASRVLVCERVNDLENLGSLFRNARAFGVDAVLLDPETTDPLGRRIVRVSMGHVLNIPFARLPDWPAALRDVVAAAGLEVVALTPGGEPLSALARGGRVAFLVGAEGPGLTGGALAHAHRAVRIPMAAGVDSVNVATAAAIALSAHFGHSAADT
ncbi:MAG: RNA methyltransferase [Acidimicrobiia bacterium]|nr:RNA methyltransferase [Acidimicrobiia bacterium]